MKKILGPAVASLALIFFTSLGLASNTPSSRREIRVVTSFYPMYIMALNVLRDVKGISLSNLTPPSTGCLHDYSLMPDDMRRLEKADILIANGAGMESFLVRVAQNYPRLKIIELAQGIPLIKGDAGPNPHVWVSIEYAISEVNNLLRFMVQVDGGNAVLYKKNGHAYINRLDALRKKMHARLDVYRGTPILTFHEAFPYFAREFGLNVIGVIEREPGSAPNAKELADTIAVIKRLHVKALFTEPQYPSAAADTIARETGARIHLLDPAVTGPETRDAYLNIMQKNLITLQNALK